MSIVRCNRCKGECTIRHFALPRRSRVTCPKCDTCTDCGAVTRSTDLKGEDVQTHLHHARCKVAPNWRASYFTIDGWTFRVAGYANDRAWNGWAVPCFDIKGAEQVAAFIEANSSGQERLDYDAGTDTWRYRTAEGSDYSWDVTGTDVTIDGRTVHVYELGNGWTWSESMGAEHVS